MSSKLGKIGRGALVALALTVLSAQILVVQAVAWARDNRQTISDRAIAWQFEPDDRIRAVVAQAGLSTEGQMYLFASLPEVVPPFEFDRYCSRREPGIGVLGCYRIQEKRIYLYDVTDERLQSIVPVITAHEMLHAAWYRFSQEELDYLEVLLEEAFAALPEDHRLRERIQSYEDYDPNSRVPELYALLGTEITELPDALEAHYTRFFSDRSLVVAAANEVYRVFDSLSGELQKLVDELEARGDVIDTRRDQYERDAAVFRADLDVYNDRVSRYNAGENVPGAEKFNQERIALVARQEALREERNAIQALIEEYNVLYDELQVLNQELTELNQGINITLEPQETIAPGNVESDS